jgi:hypothetical protein
MVPLGQYSSHLVECTKRICSDWRKLFEEEEWKAHICSFSFCWTCCKPIQTTGFHHHKESCSEALHDKKSALEEHGYCIWLRNLAARVCLSPRQNGLLFCEEHAGKSSDWRINSAAEKKFYSGILLRSGGKPAFWNSSSSAVAQRWYHNPRTVAICDIEAICSSHSMSHLNVFEIAIMNAEGHWIIPPTVIHHCISKSALFGRSSSNPRHKNLIAKYYGDIDEDESIGVGERSATWQEIGAQLDAYTKLHGRIDTWLEWSASIINHRGVFIGLKSVGYEHLLLPIPPLAFRPLHLFQKIKQILGLDELSLSQRICLKYCIRRIRSYHRKLTEPAQTSSYCERSFNMLSVACSTPPFLVKSRITWISLTSTLLISKNEQRGIKIG